MSKFGIDTGIAGKAMRAVGKTGTPDGLPAWVFENQSGDLGTNLNGSLIWCGVAGSLSVIPTGITLGSVLTLSIKSGGSNYINGTTDTTCSNNMAQDLTVAITQTGGAITGATVVAVGSGYNVGDIIFRLNTQGEKVFTLYGLLSYAINPLYNSFLWNLELLPFNYIFFSGIFWGSVILFRYLW